MESVRRKLLSNPRQTANIFSKILLTWTIPVFVKGYKNELNVNDLYQPLTEDRSDGLGDRLEKNWEEQTKSKRRSLLAAVFKTFWREFLNLAVTCVLNDICCRIGQTILLGQLLLYFREDSGVTYENAMISASGIAFLAACNAILISNFHILSWHNASKVRIAICSLVYRKAIRLSQTALGETAPGKVVNLLSNDVSRFDVAIMHLNCLWIAPVLTVIITALLWIEVGWPGIIGTAIIFIIMPIQSYAGRISSKLRMKMALRTDERVRFMDEIISGVQVIKMYAWEKPFAQLIAMARKTELNVVRQNSYVRAIFMSFLLFTTRMSVFCVMLSITVLYGADQISASKIFVITSYFSILSHSMCEMFVRGVAESSEALVGFKRLQRFLDLEEKKIIQNKSESIFVKENISVALQNVTAHWELPGDKTSSSKWQTLNNLNAELPRGKLIGVIGQVGAGKSSLLQAILRELPLKSGSIDINGTLSYASQEPWVFAGTVRQNILFGQEYNKERYDAVIKSCSLTTDLEQLPNGDRTVIGERGTSLSGGQKARVNLARATYRQSDIYLLDDPLSAVDSHVGAAIFDKCIGPKGRLAQLNATRILVTHQVHFLMDADWLLYLEYGEIVAQGTPNDLSKSGMDFMASLGTEEKQENLEVFGICSPISRETYRRISNLSLAHSISSLNDSVIESDGNEIDANHLEATTKGKFKGSVTMAYFQAGGSCLQLFALLISFVMVQFLANFCDICVSEWIYFEEARALRNYTNQTIFPSDSNSGSFVDLMSTDIFVYVQGSVLLMLLVLAMIRSIGFFKTCSASSQKLHDDMFHGTVSTKSRFFDTNPSGRILNRFSKDIGAVDVALPKLLLDSLQMILSVVGTVIVIAIVNPIFLVPVACMSVVFIFFRRAYLKTSKSIKRLEGAAQSPIFTHLVASLKGLATIRAYNAERILTQEFDAHQDLHTAANFMLFSTTSAFRFAIDTMCFIFLTCITYIFVLFDTGVTDDKIGLAITQAMALTRMLTWGIQSSTDVSTQMTAVERILEYRDLEPEPQPEKPQEIEAEWPANGSIEFKDVVYRYFAEAQPVLCGLSFVIKPKEKVGIVGRTGAGKSSLIGAIFRLACIEGKILIDGIDASTISLKKLRSSIAIIPQDPVLFSGTLRRNLDPFEEYNDADIWSALEQVELKDIAAGPSALNSTVMAHGSNFSVGQRQLICLARAILRKNRVLVLDEATANVDPQTDALIQQTIRLKFADCTVLTVAHRLHTIIDSDRILVMDAGRATEFDNAHTLLQNKQGIFNGMVERLGAQEYRRLAQTALEKYNSSHLA